MLSRTEPGEMCVLAFVRACVVRVCGWGNTFGQYSQSSRCLLTEVSRSFMEVSNVKAACADLLQYSVYLS